MSAAPKDGAVLGNAASFIVLRDLERANDLFKQAYELQPSEGWAGTLCQFCYFELWDTPSLYRDKLRKHIIAVGMRSLETEGGARHLTCEYVADAALGLGRYDIVRWCVEELCNKRNHVAIQEVGKAYLGLVALREDQRDLAIQLMLEMTKPQPILFRLARELFDAGEREAIIQLIGSLKWKVRASTRNCWLEKIAKNECPEFTGVCGCKTCRERPAS